MTTKHPNLAAALIAAQQEFGQINKDKTAKIEGDRAKFQYNYADINSVLDAVMPSLNKHGLALLCMIDSTESMAPVMRTIILHESGEKMESLFPIGALENTDMRRLGSKLTYIRRYAIMAALNIASEDDDGAEASKPAPVREPTPIKRPEYPKVDQVTGEINEEAEKQAILKQIFAIAGKLNVEDTTLKEKMRRDYRPNMDAEEFSRKMLTIDELTEMKDKMSEALRKAPNAKAVR